MEKEYCIWSTTLFNGFAGNDRQTVLNDDDGTLTGYKKTTVINLDHFFAAPVEAIQCLSDDTSRTSPYEYVTTVVYPACVHRRVLREGAQPSPAQRGRESQHELRGLEPGVHQRELLRCADVPPGPHADRGQGPRARAFA